MGSSNAQSDTHRSVAAGKNYTTPQKPVSRIPAKTPRAGRTPEHAIDLTGSPTYKKRKAEELDPDDIPPQLPAFWTGTEKRQWEADLKTWETKKAKKTEEKHEEKRVRRFRPHPPQSFQEIYNRALSQRFYVLIRTRGGTDECPEEDIEMTGSTGNIYNVHIGKRPSCTCPHNQKGKQCKHILYVMKRVLNAPFDLVYQLGLLTSELRTIFDAAPPIAASKGGDSDKRKPIEGDCPICYCEFEADSPESIVWCAAACGQNIHEHCFKMWAKTKGGTGKVTCPMCRSLWKGDKDLVAKVQKGKGKLEEGYVNVADQLGISHERGEATKTCLIMLCLSLVRSPSRSRRRKTAGAAFGGFGGTHRNHHAETAEIINYAAGTQFLDLVKMAQIPPMMRSLVAPKKCSPAGYEIIERQTPKVTKPEHVLLRMKAVSITTGDTQFAAGMIDILHRTEYPYVISMEGSGIVVAVGDAVKNLKVGDAVYGIDMDKPIFTRPPAGFASDYALTEERFMHKKPENMSFEEASALSGYSVTAYQTIRRGLQLQGRDSLAGQTVYIPAALSASGSTAIQVARNFFGADKIISTVSTPKMPLVEEHLPGMVNQLYDYQTQDICSLIGRGTVDFAFNTQWATFDESAAVLKPETGILMSIASVPTRAVMRTMLGPEYFPLWLGWLLDFAQLWTKWKLRGTSIKHELVSGSPNVREDMDVVAGMLEEGKVRGVLSVVEFGDLDEVRRACEKVAKGKGGLGKLVIRISGDEED
ncbi:hypothetical protein FZEAL_129 [Fusarium zealandicum]|uniref:Enoyl reductase (ER) domain-containing protein n=1 Tax=Fusarium zealandicum TaxID=1053134 RepID=A0A8H4UVU4_9HYPO|nr:hypothetical protein FZEAL_129 [Fusarium zealandicum]